MSGLARQGVRQDCQQPEAGVRKGRKQSRTVGSALARVLRWLARGARQGVRQGCLQLVRWNPKGRKQSRNCSLHLCSNFLTGSGVRQSFPDFLSEI